jgi:hypothetical protein
MVGDPPPSRGKTSTAGFDFTSHMRALCADLAARLPDLAHVDTTRMAIRFCQTRRRTRHGLYASLTPLRFAGGALVSRRRGRSWSVERLYDDAGREMLYLLSFYLPRFLDRAFADKLCTVVHELWHVSPDFNGDLRRHEGRYFAHGPCQKQYDALVSSLAAKWRSLDPPPEIYDFLRHDFRALVRRHGPIVGQMIRTPKLIECQPS